MTDLPETSEAYVLPRTDQTSLRFFGKRIAHTDAFSIFRLAPDSDDKFMLYVELSGAEGPERHGVRIRDESELLREVLRVAYSCSETLMSASRSESGLAHLLYEDLSAGIAPAGASAPANPRSPSRIVRLWSDRRRAKPGITSQN